MIYNTTKSVKGKRQRCFCLLSDHDLILIILSKSLLNCDFNKGLRLSSRFYVSIEEQMTQLLLLYCKKHVTNENQRQLRYLL